MFLEIVTPEASIYRGEVESVTVPGVMGEFQMLKNHAPIVSLLQKGKVKVKGGVNTVEGFETKFSKGEGNSIVLPIESGTLELNNNKIIILVD